MAQVPCLHCNIHCNCVLVVRAPFSVPLHQKNESNHVSRQQHFLGLHWLLSFPCSHFQQICCRPQKAWCWHKAGCAVWFSGHILCKFIASSCIYCRTVERILPPGTQSKPIHLKKQSLLSGTQTHHHTTCEPIWILHHICWLYSNIYCFSHCSVHNTLFVPGAENNIWP